MKDGTTSEASEPNEVHWMSKPKAAKYRDVEPNDDKAAIHDYTHDE